MCHTACNVLLLIVVFFLKLCQTVESSARES